MEEFPFLSLKELKIIASNRLDFLKGNRLLYKIFICVLAIALFHSLAFNLVQVIFIFHLYE